MAIPYTQATMANVRAVDGTFISYPFLDDGDTSTKVYNMICTQRESDYNAAQIDLDDPMTNATTAGVIELPFTSDSSAYFVGDTGHSSIGGGMLQFTRTFANIPQTTTTASGSAFVTFPGIGRATGGALTFADMSSISMTSGTRGITITTSSVHGLSVDDFTILTMDYTEGSDPFIHSVSGTFRVIAVPSTTELRVDVGHYWPSQVTLTLGSGRVYQDSLSSRPPINKNVSTLTRYDYMLPGVTSSISNVLDIIVQPAFVATNQFTGEITDSVGFGAGNSPYPATLPNDSEYVNMIIEGQNIVIESSLAEWAGNILVMTTKTCKAQ
jgi:hypothetical protein